MNAKVQAPLLSNMAVPHGFITGDDCRQSIKQDRQLGALAPQAASGTKCRPHQITAESLKLLNTLFPRVHRPRFPVKQSQQSTHFSGQIPGTAKELGAGARAPSRVTA